MITIIKVELIIFAKRRVINQPVDFYLSICRPTNKRNIPVKSAEIGAKKGIS